MASISTWFSWTWPLLIILVLFGLSLFIPGGPETGIFIGLLAIEVLIVIYKVVSWFVAEANARSAQ